MDPVSSSEKESVIQWAILRQIEKMIKDSGRPVSVTESIKQYSGIPPATEIEVRSAIEQGIKNGLLNRSQEYPYDKSLLDVAALPRIPSTTSTMEIVMSMPELTELGLTRVKTRYEMVETREAFRKVISRAGKCLRISSPFLESNILEKNAIPDIRVLLQFLFEKGCRIKVLSRLNNDKRMSQVRWLLDFADDNGFTENLELYSYHVDYPNSSVWSSTHAKLIIADCSIAYIGSAELRLNSLQRNFEVGCIVEGASVQGLCEAFDLMTRYSKRVP